jgi:hypothetical protein
MRLEDMNDELMRLKENQLLIMKRLGGFESSDTESSNKDENTPHNEPESGPSSRILTLDELVGCGHGEHGEQHCSRCSWVSGHEGHVEYDPHYNFGLPNHSKQKYIGTYESLPLACKGSSSNTILGGCMEEWSAKSVSQGQTHRSDYDSVQLKFYNACEEAKRQLRLRKPANPGSISVYTASDIGKEY